MAWFAASYQDISLGSDQVRMDGSFATNGAGAVSGVKGKGFAVARTGTGTYRISLGTTALPTPFKALISAQLTPQCANGVVHNLKVLTDSSSAATPFIDVVNNDAAGAAADFTGRVYFMFCFGTSGLNS